MRVLFAMTFTGLVPTMAAQDGSGEAGWMTRLGDCGRGSAAD
jgi:hypothetical protein